MRTFLFFTLAFWLSQIVSQIVAIQLAIAFGAREEFIVVMIALGLFSAISIAVMSIVFVASKRARSIDFSSIALAFAIIVLAAALIATASIADHTTPTRYDLQIMTEFAMPALLAVLIQWWIIRRLRRTAL